MGKYDCNKCLDYYHEEQRMCKELNYDCFRCSLNTGLSGRCEVADSQDKIDIVQKWSDENPEQREKTILEDFREKYPDYVHEINDIPVICVCHLFETNGCDENCTRCWNRPLSEVEK